MLIKAESIQEQFQPNEIDEAFNTEIHRIKHENIERNNFIAALLVAVDEAA